MDSSNRGALMALFRRFCYPDDVRETKKEDVHMKSTWAKIVAIGASVGAVVMFWRKRSDDESTDTAA